MRNRQSNNRFKQEKMKSKFLKIAFAAALAVVSGVTAYQAQDKEILSDLALDMYGNSTGKCTATSYWSPIGKGLYHSHSCSYCCN